MKSLFRRLGRNRISAVVWKLIARYPPYSKKLTELKLSELGRLVVDNWDNQLIGEYLDGYITRDELTKILLRMDREKKRKLQDSNT